MSGKLSVVIGVRVNPRGAAVAVELTETIDDGYRVPETDVLKSMTPLAARQLAAQLLATADEIEARS